MTLPPDPKNKPSAIGQVGRAISIIAIGSTISFLLFSFLMVSLFVANDIFFPSPELLKAKQPKIKRNITMAIKIQALSMGETDKFIKTFDELAIDDKLVGDDTASLEDVRYKIQSESKDLFTIGAKPLDVKLHSYTGAVLRYKGDRVLAMTKSILCESDAVGADGTDTANLPIVNRSGKLQCAPSWTSIYEINND